MGGVTVAWTRACRGTLTRVHATRHALFERSGWFRTAPTFAHTCRCFVHSGGWQPPLPVTVVRYTPTIPTRLHRMPRARTRLPHQRTATTCYRRTPVDNIPQPEFFGPDATRRTRCAFARTRTRATVAGWLWFAARCFRYLIANPLLVRSLGWGSG